ncbi:DNA-3-methyladenine glycosylase family protein [Amorphus orientalis]|uniref:DNA-3-methyladenine glycosylase II n=1 Tax=Amorphus orientalis TaxID=649198 RepID=A0AAE4AR09_9HYPH|nr:DNA-3-methyladenine glycosylase [Amorphus orientalis]MDQ0314666.1 DNA-3-methyladenine glycosylase II [Amorphus orientalis]
MARRTKVAEADGAASGGVESPPAPIVTDADVARGLEALVALDGRLKEIRSVAGEVPLRLRAPGFEGLARIVVSQQLSVASAASIWARLAERLDPFGPDAVRAASDEELRAAGLSRPKVRTLRAVADAVGDGLDLDHVCRLPAGDAHERLCAVKGIGPWTADIYLLFCAGHPDIFPVGDLALQNAVADGLGLPARPSTKELAAIAEAWSPWRGVAARLFWSYYRARREGREAVPV